MFRSSRTFWCATLQRTSRCNLRSMTENSALTPTQGMKLASSGSVSLAPSRRRSTSTGKVAPAVLHRLARCCSTRPLLQQVLKCGARCWGLQSSFTLVAGTWAALLYPLRWHCQCVCVWVRACVCTCGHACVHVCVYTFICLIRRTCSQFNTHLMVMVVVTCLPANYSPIVLITSAAAWQCWLCRWDLNTNTSEHLTGTWGIQCRPWLGNLHVPFEMNSS